MINGHALSMALTETVMKAEKKNKKDLKRFNKLMSQSYKRVYNLAYRLSRSRADAEDLTQEAFLRAYRSFDSYEGDKPFENWIFRIVTRLFLDLKRRQSRRVKSVSYDAPLRPDGVSSSIQFESAWDGPNPEQALMNGTVSEEIEESLALLTPQQRELIYMADIQQIPYAEIAEKLQAPVGTIRSRLHRAHKQLRQHLTALGAAQQLGMSNA
jgi:RNA polymerase sigma-70 factor (ECF subfamily)